MKTRVLFFAMVLVLVSSGVYAGQKRIGKSQISTNVELKANNRVVVNLQHIAGKTVGFELFNQNGEKVIAGRMENRTKGNFRHNFNYLSEGLYTYCVKDEAGEIYSMKIIKTRDGSLELRCAEKQICTAISSSSDNNSQVEIRLHKPEASSVTILICEESGDAISERKIKNGENLALTYDLSAFPQGNYLVRVLDGKKLVGYKKVSL